LTKNGRVSILFPNPPSPGQPYGGSEPFKQIPPLRGIYQSRAAFPAGPIRSAKQVGFCARWRLPNVGFFLNFRHTKSWNSKPGRDAQFTRLQSPGCGRIDQQPGSMILPLDISGCPSQRPKPQAKASLWMESSVSPHHAQEKSGCATAVCQLSSAPISDWMPAAGYTGCSRSRSRVRPPRSCRRRAARLAGRDPSRLEAPLGGASPKPVDQPLHRCFSELCVSAICGLQSVAGDYRFFSPTS